MKFKTIKEIKKPSLIGITQRVETPQYKKEMRKIEEAKFPIKTKVKKKLTKLQKIEKILKKKIKARPILKKEKEVVLRIKKSEPAEHVSRFFKSEWEETKKSMFLK